MEGFLEAVSGGDIAIINKQLEGGISVNTRTSVSGDTPLIYASKYGRLGVVELLLSKGDIFLIAIIFQLVQLISFFFFLRC